MPCGATAPWPARWRPPSRTCSRWRAAPAPACFPAGPGLPRTDDDLEQAFGAQRDHERRATGRKGAFPAAVLRGEVRLIAASATRLHEQGAADLARTDWAAWRTLRTRFRRDPQACLRTLEAKAIQLTSPA